MSLGSDCTVALHLRDKNLRKVAYPFDWCVTPMKSVIEMFDNGFEDFLKDDNLTFLKSDYRKSIDDQSVKGELNPDIITPCYCHNYNMMLPHDFSKNREADLSSVQTKYKKRIERLKSQLNETDSEFTFIANNAPTSPTSWRAKQFTIASGTTFVNDFKDWKSRLSIILNKKYPNLKYTLYNLKEFKKL